MSSLRRVAGIYTRSSHDISSYVCLHAGTRRACSVAFLSACTIMMPRTVHCNPQILCSTKRVGLPHEHPATDTNSVVTTTSQILVPVQWIIERVARSLQLLHRCLTLLAAWSPMVVAGFALGFLNRYQCIPKEKFMELQESWWKLLLELVESSGPTFIKAAQWASTRRDMFPEEVCDRCAS